MEARADMKNLDSGKTNEPEEKEKEKEEPAADLQQPPYEYHDPCESLYQDALNLMLKMAHALNEEQMAVIVSSAKESAHDTLTFFKDCFARLRSHADTIPLPNQVQWLACWARFLLFNDNDSSPRFPLPQSAEFKGFITYLKQNYEDKALPVSLRARFGLLIAYAHLIPELKSIHVAKFEILPRPVRLKLAILPEEMNTQHDKQALEAFLFWLNKATTISGGIPLETYNLRMDCKQLAAEFTRYFHVATAYESVVMTAQSIYAQISLPQPVTRLLMAPAVHEEETAATRALSRNNM